MKRRLIHAALAVVLFALASPVTADQVVELLPGGRASLSPVTDTGRTGTGAAEKHFDHTGESSHSPDGDLGLQARQFAAGADLTCAVPKTGAPRDLNVTNRANYALPAGTRIKWQVAGTGLSGFFALINDLPAGKQLIAEGILPAGAAPGSACTARVI